MKKIFFVTIAAMVMVLLSQGLFSQPWVVNQVVVASGGSYSNPDDYVTLNSFNPQSGESLPIGTVYTQSVQDVILDEANIYVAAQDSIAVFNLTNFEKVAVVAAPGVTALALEGDRLLASFAWPAVDGFLKIYQKATLDLIAVVDGISDEAAGMLVVDQTLYLAVPGGWSSTEGKVASVDLHTMTLISEVNLGSSGVGVRDLFFYNDSVIATHVTPWGDTTGVITKMSTDLTQIYYHNYPYTFGKGIGMWDDMLYVIMDGGIGSIDMHTMLLVNESVVAPPSLVISAAEIDTVNQLFYVATTDYATQGEGTIYNLTGEQTGQFEAGIAPEAIAIEYVNTSGIDNNYAVADLWAYPNPAQDYFTIEIPEEMSMADCKLLSLDGKVLRSGTSRASSTMKISVQGLSPGYYICLLMDGSRVATTKIVVN